MNRPPRVLVNVCLFLLALAATCAAVGALVPEPDLVHYAAKFAAFEKQKDEIDLLLFGTSLTHYGLIPDVIDQEFRKAGQPIRSFNFGLFGAEPFEIDHMIGRALALRPERLKWIVVEWVPWSAAPRHDGNLFSERSVFWHTPTETLDAVRSALLAKDPLGERLRLALDHVRLMFLKYSAFGQAERIGLSLLGMDVTDSSRPIIAEVVQGRGWRSVQETKELTRGTDFFRLNWVLTRVRQEVDAGNQAEVDLSTFNRRAQQRQVAAVTKAGVRLIYMTSPASWENPEPYRLAERGDLPEFLPFNSFERYPRLYQTRYFYDAVHLNDEGARIASRVFAGELARYLEVGDAPR